MMQPIFKVIFSMVVLLFAGQSCAVDNIENTDLVIWNKIVKENVFQSIPNCEEHTSSQENDRVLYIYACKPTDEQTEPSLSIAIEVGSAGSMLNKAEFEQALAASDSNESTFPTVGLRAQMGTPFFGPGGGSYSLISTTQDERFDLNVNFIETGTEGDHETLDIVDISTRLHQAYDAVLSTKD